jgi:hypothetical protein
MSSRSVNDSSRVVRITIIGDATTWSATSGDSRGAIYNRNIFILPATDFISKRPQFDGLTMDFFWLLSHRQKQRQLCRILIQT